MTAVADGHQFQTQITPYAVLEMHDKIAVVQVGEINVERRNVSLERGRIFDDADAGFYSGRKFPHRLRQQSWLRHRIKTASEGADLALRRGVGFVSRLFEPQARR